MNWGNSLVLVFILFAGFIFYLVYGCMNTDINLVSKEYYKEELDYQKVLDKTANAKSLKNEISLSLNDKTLQLELPAEIKTGETSGNIFIYSVQNASRDQNKALAFDTDGRQSIDVSKLLPGAYIAKISYSNAGKDFYSEIKFKI